MRISEEHLKIFSRQSGDTNPLHCDLSYAKRTPFGGLVVHGVAMLLCGLAQWARQRPIRLRHCTAVFLKPLLSNQDFSLHEEDLGGKEVRLTFRRGGTTLARFEFSWEPVAAGESFSLDSSALAIPPLQIEQFFWATRFVGTDTPGRQALFSKLQFTFHPSNSSQDEFKIEEITTTKDDRFKLATISGKSNVADFYLEAFCRPEAPHVSTEDIQEALAQTQLGRNWSGKSVFVSGCSRGFGSAIARAFSLVGAEVFAGFRSLPNDLHDVLTAGAKPVIADLAQDQLPALPRKIDFLILNAFPPIIPSKASELSAEELASFVAEVLRLHANTFLGSVAQLSAGATVVHISSAYLEVPEPQLAQYLAAKAAVEAYMRALALEYPKIHFINLRLPKMLTDQTNSLFTKGTMLSTATVAAAALAELSRDFGTNSFSTLTVETA